MSVTPIEEQKAADAALLAKRGYTKINALQMLANSRPDDPELNQMLVENHALMKSVAAVGLGHDDDLGGFVRHPYPLSCCPVTRDHAVVY